MLETEIVLIFDHALASEVIDKGKDSEDDGELGDADAGATKSVDDGPGITKPSDFGEN